MIRAGVFLMLVGVLVVAGCAPGNVRFDTQPAGFWAGLWHGLICVVTFVISLFSDQVQMYEVNNNGAWYNLGFLLGAACLFSGGCSCRTSCGWGRSRKEKEWDEIGARVEEKVRRGNKSWLDESDRAAQDDREWEEIGRKIEEKIKRELRDWSAR